LKFFEKDAIMWTGKNELHDFYKRLLNLHSSNPALRAGDPDVKTERLNAGGNKAIFTFLRRARENEVLAILNFSSSPADFSIDSVNGKFKEIFQCQERDFSNDKNIHLHAWEYLVFEKL